MRIRFHPEADAEFQEAIRWYGRQRMGLDAEFVLCVEEVLERIGRWPEMFPVVHRHARRAIVRRFPFVIIFEIGHEEIRVLSVFHSRRDPAQWRSRV